MSLIGVDAKGQPCFLHREQENVCTSFVCLRELTWLRCFVWISAAQHGFDEHDGTSQPESDLPATSSCFASVPLPVLKFRVCAPHATQASPCTIWTIYPKRSLRSTTR
jgi:hypothetical protein